MKKPIYIWVVNRKDGWTTFGMYCKGQRRVFAKARSLAEFDNLVDFGTFVPYDPNATITWAGDPLPAAWARRVDHNGHHTGVIGGAGE